MIKRLNKRHGGGSGWTHEHHIERRAGELLRGDLGCMVNEQIKVIQDALMRLVAAQRSIGPRRHIHAKNKVAGRFILF